MMAKSKCRVVYEPHPIALELPRLSEDEQRELADDIAAVGLLDPIVIFEEMILDGIGRQTGCDISGVEPRYVQFEGDDPEGFVASKNAKRRHLTKEQKVTSLTALAMRKQARLNLARQIGEQDHAPNTGNNADSWGGSNAAISEEDVQRIAEETGTSERTVERTARVLDKAIKPVIDALKAGSISTSAAEQIALLPKKEQPDAILKQFLHRDVAAAWDAGELTRAQCKKLSELRAMLQVDELNKIRAKAGRAAAANSPSTQVVAGHKSNSGPRPAANEKPKGTWAPYHKLLGKLVRTIDECATAANIPTNGPRVKAIHAAFNAAHQLVLALEKGR